MPLYRASLVLSRPDVGGMETKRMAEIAAPSLNEAESELETVARRGGFSAYRVEKVISLEPVT
jgi:hypothetical protein